ncbi:MAG: hypothetical protein H7195_03090 [Chryseobacterium sp.]|nr:hypothetical protein [Chryseobacterium sp.]
MKKLFYLSVFVTIFSCNKKTDQKITVESKNDSLNKIIEKKNDSITKLNNQNIYKDWSGNHRLTHNSISKSGEINFQKIGRDEYKVFGSIISGDNSLKITGNMKQFSEDYMNLDGEIVQNIKQDGAAFIRKDKNTFKKQGKFWRLQNKVNGAGFIDYIDIYK